MLHKAKTLQDYKLGALDGEIGKVKEFYFDDQHWTIRYLVANTGNWIPDRLVLISSYALVSVNEGEKTITTNLTKEHIEASPFLNPDKPISQQDEEAYYRHYGWPIYWNGSYPRSTSLYPYHLDELGKESAQPGKIEDSHLHSTRAVSSTHAVIGYRIQAEDGEIGNVDDFVIDDQTWAICHLIVGTRDWWPGKQVLVSPQWIEKISRSESKVFVNLRRETIKQGPEYTEESLLIRD